MSSAPKLGILAGGGDLPKRLIEVCRSSSRQIVVIALRGQTDPTLCEGVPHVWTRLGALAGVLPQLRSEGVTELVLAGRVQRPSLGQLRPDFRTLQHFLKAGGTKLGDDGLLRGIVRILEEEEGFKVRGIDDILEDCLATEGAYGLLEPDGTARADIARGMEVVRALGAADIGQAAIVQQGLVLAVEAIEGTDALIERSAALRRDGPGPVLVKLRKPQQERRVDLPTIGLSTLRHAAAAGLAGIAIEAGGVLLVDRDALGPAADEAGLFLVGVRTGQ